MGMQLFVLGMFAVMLLSTFVGLAAAVGRPEGVGAPNAGRLLNGTLVSDAAPGSVAFNRSGTLVNGTARGRAPEFVAARENFVQAWRALKEARQLGSEERNTRLARAIEAVADARIAAALRLEERGADANKTQAFVAFLEDVKVRSVNASFEERKALFRELHVEWKKFVRSVVSDFLWVKVQRHVGRLEGVLTRANESISALEANGTSAEQIAELRAAYDEAVAAVGAVVQEGTMRSMMKNLLVARAEVRKVVKMVNAVRNGEDAGEVEEEEVSDDEVAGVPEEPAGA